MSTEANQNGPEVIMIEDDHQIARGFINYLDISDVIKEISYVTDFDSLSNSILEDNPNQVFWVDVNLGLGRENDGIEMIKIIRDRKPDALIIVYSGNVSHEKACKSNGADHFFRKGSGNYEETMAKIRQIIMDFLSSNNALRFKTLTEYYAQVAHIEPEQGWVKLECYNKDGTSQAEQYVKINVLEDAVGGYDNLVVDTWVKVSVVEGHAEYKIIFKESEEPLFAKRNNTFTNEEEDDDDDLMNSSIWEPIN